MLSVLSAGAGAARRRIMLVEPEPRHDAAPASVPAPALTAPKGDVQHG
jgi:hypothetical protein